MPRKYTILCAWLILLMAGCSVIQRPSTPTPSQGSNAQNAPAEPVKFSVQRIVATRTLKEYLGLSLGRTWTYAGEGNEFAAYTARVTHARDNFYQLEINNGGVQMAQIIELRRDGAFEVFTTAENDYEPGKSLLNDPVLTKQRTTPDRKILPWPLRRGVRWTLPDGSKARVVTIGRSRTVPFGRLRSVVHIEVVSEQEVPVEEIAPGASPPRLRKETSVVDTYYARGVGLIERSFTSNGYMVSSKLDKMTLMSK